MTIRQCADEAVKDATNQEIKYCTQNNDIIVASILEQFLAKVANR